MTIALSLTAVVKRYRAGIPGCSAHVDALRGIDLQVARGEVVGIAGGPGAGKSTLLLCAAGLLHPDSGVITWFGADHPPEPALGGVAYVPTRPAYYPFLTVSDVLDSYSARRRGAGAHRGDTAEVVQALALTEHRSERVARLQSDLLQRVAIAQALLGGARLLLVDAGLGAGGDAPCEGGHELVQSLNQRGVTIILAARHAAALERVASRVVTLVNGVVSGACPRAGGILSSGRNGGEPARVAEQL